MNLYIIDDDDYEGDLIQARNFFIINRNES